jgi:hypothetical protein
MFEQLLGTINKQTAQKSKKPMVYKAYGDIFITLAVSQQQQMNQLLSVNCAFVAALHRLHGAAFFGTVLKHMHETLLKNHALMSTDSEESHTQRTKVKNILNCLLHLFLF